jgi:hypothetical protein
MPDAEIFAVPEKYCPPHFYLSTHSCLFDVRKEKEGYAIVDSAAT